MPDVPDGLLTLDETFEAKLQALRAKGIDSVCARGLQQA